MMITLRDGQEYAVAHQFSDTRALIIYDGLYCFVDKEADGQWDLSGAPANDEEKPVLAALTAGINDQSVVTITQRP